MDPDRLLDVIASSTVVVCDLFGTWLELGVSLHGCLFSYWIPVAAIHAHHPSPPTHPLISTMHSSYNITAVSVKASQNQAGHAISDD